MCVSVFGSRVWNISESVRFALLVTSQRAGAAVSGCDSGRRGPGRLDLSCVCAARVPVSPAVGAVLPSLWLVPSWHRVQCDVRVVSCFKLMGPIGALVRCTYSCLVGGLPFVARAA